MDKLKKIFYSIFNALKRAFYAVCNNWFRWYDMFIITAIVALVIMLLGDYLGAVIFSVLFPGEETAFTDALKFYGVQIGVWIVLIAYLFIVNPDKPILRTFWTKYKGNSVALFLLGLAVGGGMNLFCAVMAIFNKDIAVYLSDDIQFFKVFAVFIMVFFQSGSEEIICRGFLYQRLRRSYRSPWVAIIGNSMVFACLHLLNPGITILSFLNLILCGVFLALMIYYFESMWMAIAFHTAWNFMQSIVLGLPNSGIVFDFSVFKLDAASATNSFAYNVNFGIEGTILSSLVLAFGIVVIIVLGQKQQRENLWVVGDTII
ncbi:MAG: CPBP family intramembrane metalloprotease [Butyrivibrio sp.]|nr:CPBP family intramembrane metalloprotease [Butyrivibrio sp.]